MRETREGRMQEVEVRLSDWVFNAIRSNEVLTLNRQYFRLRKPLERRLYEIARKHCGWPGKAVKFGLDTLQRKCGSKSTDFEFRRLKIGRASCRERVWQYGEISGCPVSLKKKKKK